MRSSDHNVDPHDDQRWQELADLDALGIPPEGEDAVFFAAYAAAHPECAAEQAAWDGLLGDLRGPADELEGGARRDDGDDDQAFVAGLLKTFRASQTSTPGAQIPSADPSTETRAGADGLATVHSLPARSRWPLLAVGALAAAAALAVVLLPDDPASPDTPPRQAQVTPPPTQAPATTRPPSEERPSPKSAPESALIALSSPGGLRINGEPATAGDRVIEGATLSAEVETCMVFDAPFASVCLGPGTTASLRHAHAGDRIFDLERGALVATLDPIPEGHAFKVLADGYQARAVGTVFSVRIADNAELGVFEGVVELRGPAPERPARSLRALEHTVFEVESEIGALPEDLEAWASTRTSLADLWRGLEAAPSQLHLGTSSAALSIDGTPLADLPRERPQGLDMLLASGEHNLDVAGRSGALSRVINASPDAAITLASDLLEPPHNPAKTRIQTTPSAGPTGPSLAELRRLASDARAARSWRDAKGAYEDLLERYPEAPEAHNARVQLGDLLRRRLGQPAEALVHFDAYLDRGGPLDAEARFGKVLALQQLGRRTDEARAIDTFLAHHPEHIEAEKLRARARELTALAEP